MIHNYICYNILTSCLLQKKFLRASIENAKVGAESAAEQHFVLMAEKNTVIFYFIIIIMKFFHTKKLLIQAHCSG
jgi:hypothetical protein